MLNCGCGTLLPLSPPPNPYANYSTDRPHSAHGVPYLLLGKNFVLSLSVNSPATQKQPSHPFNPQVFLMQSLFAQKYRMIVCKFDTRLF